MRDNQVRSIFLSHNWQDKAFVKKLAQDLGRAGVRVWLDEAEMGVGDSLIGEIETGIQNSDYLGVVLSPHSVDAEWVLREVRIALTEEVNGKKIKVLPLLLADCSIPPFLLDKIYADFRHEGNYGKAFLKLAERLGVPASALAGEDNWLVGQWYGEWLWRNRNRYAVLEVAPSSPLNGRMIIQYSKAQQKTVLEQYFKVQVDETCAKLNGTGYKFLVRGSASGYYLDSLWLRQSTESELTGYRVDKRKVRVPVRFHRISDLSSIERPRVPWYD